MRTVRTLAASADRSRIRGRFPAKTLVLSLAFTVTAIAVFALVDLVAPPPSAPAAALNRKAPAQASAAEPRKADLPAPGAGPLLAAGGVILGAVAVIFLLKRALRSSRHVPGGRKLLMVRDVLAMGPKRAIYLIGLEHRNLVIGLSGDQLTLLSEYSVDQEDETAAAEAPVREGRAGDPAQPQPAAAPLPSIGTASILDVQVGDDVIVPSPETAPAAQAAVERPRLFPFAAADGSKGPAVRQRVDRVPHKFRQLLEQAAAEGPRR